MFGFLFQKARVHLGGEVWTEVAGTCLLVSQPEARGRKRKLEVGVAFNLKVLLPVACFFQEDHTS